MIKHVVFFKLNDKAQAPTLKAMLEGLNGVIPELKMLEAGVDLIGSDRSMDLALISEFMDLEGLKAYQVHPEHLKVTAWVKEHCSLVKAVDFAF